MFLKSLFFMDINEMKPYQKEFDETCLELSMRRLYILNIAMLLISLYLFVNDFFILSQISNSKYKTTLFYIHTGIFLIVVVYLILMQVLKRLHFENLASFKCFFVHAYIMISLTFGIALCYNSIEVNFNIYSYMTIVLFLLAFIPSRPMYTVSIVVFCQIAFMVILTLVLDNHAIVITTQVNSTVTVVVGILIYMNFYYYRRNDFLNSKKLFEREKNLATLFEINPLSLIVVDMDNGKIHKLNKRAAETFGVDIEKIGSININDFFVNDEDKNILLKKARDEKHIDEYIMQVNNNGKRSWMMFNCELINYNGKECILVVVIDITKIKLRENELSRKASIDALTGVLNRLKGMEVLERMYNQLGNTNSSIAIVFCDINSLKMINDTYGHTEGDLVISLVSEVILNVQDSDDIVFRFGGDEFVIVFANKSEAECIEKMKAIKHALDDYQRKNNKPYAISISYGIQIIEAENQLILEDAMKMADEKMYAFKKSYYHETKKFQT
ncbi:MAG: diguanylate cyclase [Clostridiales bacterium]|nr:diguanylate cyclase [Clostridiales bacterium]